MSTVDVTLIDPALSGEHKRELESHLTRALQPIAGLHMGSRQWRVVVRPVRSTPATDDRTAPPAAAGRSIPVDYADWHARLAGTGSRTPGTAGSTA